MIDKLKHLVKDDVVLKVFSLLLAVLLWFYVQIVQNPEVSYEILEVPITITGEANINSDGFVVSNLSKKLKTNVTISTKRSLIHTIDAGDLMAVIDVSSCNEVGDYNIPIKVRTQDSEINVINKSPSGISVYIDRLVTVEKPVNISFDGKLDPDYFIDKDNISIVPSKAVIKTPELEASKIAQVGIFVDMTNINSKLTGVFQGVVKNSSNDLIENKNVTLVTESFNVTVPVYKRKTVPIEIKNLPSDIKYNLNLKNVEVAGESNVINSLDCVYGYVDGFDKNNIQSSYNITLELDNLIRIDEEAVKLFPEINEEAVD